MFSELAPLHLGGVRCPQKGREGADEPFSAEALSFTRLRCMQRECEVEVEAVDKTGTFLGSLFMTAGGKPFNLAIGLLNAGLVGMMRNRL